MMTGPVFDGERFERGEHGYEQARRGAVWNARTPERFPDVIVIARSEADVVCAVQWAGAEQMTIGVRSGGHSWAGNHVRDGGMLLDLSLLRGVELDTDAATASVQPGCPGDELVAKLGEAGLFFPAGHCAGVGIGGYLLQVFRWAQEVGPRVPRNMELMLIVHRSDAGELEIAVTGPVLAERELEAREALALLESCPAYGRAKLAEPYIPVALEDLYAGPGATPAPPRPEMAYSVEDDTYIALYGVWQDPAHDAANVAWATERMREMEDLATGIQLADENLGLRPARFLSEAHMSRLDELRAVHDPHGRFHPWMGRPAPAGR
jgi:FAD/FMN-containing dehydrogenase